MIEEFTPLTITMLVVLFPILIVIGFILVPVVFGLLAIVAGVLTFLVGVVCFPFVYAFNQAVEWNDRRKERNEMKEIERWAEENPEAVEFARKNPGGIYEGDIK